MSGTFSRDGRGISSRMSGIKAEKPEKYALPSLCGAGELSKNLVFRNGRLCSVPSPDIDFGTVSASDSRVMTASSSEGNIELIRVGSALYGRSGGGAPVLISSDLFIDERTVIHRMNGAFYIVTGMTVYKVNDSFGLSTVTPHVPVLYKSYGISAPEPTPFYEEPNALSDCVDINYAVGSTQTLMIYLPDCVNVSGIESVTAGSAAYSHEYSLVSGGSKKKAVSFPEGIKGNVTIRLRLSQTSSDGSLSLADFKQVRDGFLRARYTVACGSLGDGYSIVLGTCGYDKKFYVVGISDMAYIKTDSVASVYIEQKATAALAYGDGTLVFTPNRIIYVRASGGGVIADGVSFDVSVIKRDFGCDAPRSVVGFDDKIFFLNSAFGVFYINKFGYTERDGTCLVSLPIKSGLLSHTKEELTSAVSGCTCSAFCISVGGDVYLYKYSNGLPSSADENEEKQEKYCWSGLDVIDVNGFLSSVGTRFRYLENTTGNVCVFDPDEKCGDGDDVDFEYVSAPSDLGYVGEKVISAVEICAKFTSDADVTLYFDGGDGYTVSLPALDADVLCAYVARPPRKRFSTVSVAVSAEHETEIEKIAFSYFKTRA